VLGALAQSALHWVPVNAAQLFYKLPFVADIEVGSGPIRLREAPGPTYRPVRHSAKTPRPR
ncbi:MAG: hypothetical protein WBQ10_08905, partial [Terriglobales bacterium]